MFFLTGSGLRRYTKAQLKHDRDAAREECVRLDGVVRERDNRVVALEEENGQLKADRVDVGVERHLREQAEARAEDLQTRLRATEAKLRTANKVDVPQMYRHIDPGEQSTEPTGIRHVGAEFPADYLDRTRQAWQPVPLADSPLAKAPVGPAVLKVDLGDEKFTGVALVSAPAEPAARQVLDALGDPVRLLSEYLADSGPSVTVGRDTRTA